MLRPDSTKIRPEQEFGPRFRPPTNRNENRNVPPRSRDKISNAAPLLFEWVIFLRVCLRDEDEEKRKTGHTVP